MILSCQGFILFLFSCVVVMTTSTEMNAFVSGDSSIQLYSKEDIKKQCFNAMRDFDPPCKFQTILYSVNSSHPENCAHCVAERGNFGGSADTRFRNRISGSGLSARAFAGEDDEGESDDEEDKCPLGWSGVDCSVCDVSNSCPSIVVNGKKRNPIGCTKDCFLPTTEELSIPRRTKNLDADQNRLVPEASFEAGKVFSCQCGGDAKTDPYCMFQKDQSFLFHVVAASGMKEREEEELKVGVSSSFEEAARIGMRASDSIRSGTNSNGDNSREVEINVRAYGGMPTQDNGNYPEWKYKFASAAVWDANFTKCTYSVEKCRAPYPSDHTCVLYDCTAGKTACPPSDVEKCPGRTAMKCGTNETDNSTDTLFWQHPCNPLVTPVSDRGMQFWCDINATKTSDGSNVCYWTQPGVIPTLAVTCRVGNCVYEEQTMAKENWCSLEETVPVYWTGDALTRAFMLLFVSLIIAGMVMYVLWERKQRYNEEDEEESDVVVRDEDLNTEALLNDSAAYSDDGYSSVNNESSSSSSSSDADGDDDVSNDNESFEEENGEEKKTKKNPARRKRSRRTSSLSTQIPQRSSKDMMVLSWRHLFVDASVKNDRKKSTKHILRDVSGMAGPGGVFAVLGPSGAGKSTLIDTLAGRTPPDRNVRGAIYLDGQVASNVGLRAASACVTQDDVLPGTSTVWEHLLFHATLRMPIGTSTNALRRRVGQTMRDLGIEKLADSLIGDQFSRGLSGGEKRRVSIATELLMSPGIMFLDEPTTGLDSTNAAKVVDILSKLGSRHGVTVLLSIHQPRPDIFRLLDRILILSSVGSVVYSGPSVSAKGFFESLAYVPPRPRDVHVADFILDVVINSPEKIVAKVSVDFLKSEIAIENEERQRALMAEFGQEVSNEAEIVNTRNKYAAPFSKQCRWLCGRYVRRMYRHPFLIYVHVMATFLAALGVGLIFKNAALNQGGIQNRMGALFFILIFLTLMSLSSLPVWKEDRLLFIRERANRVYGTNAYFVSTVLFDILPMRVVPPFLFGFITYGMIGLNEGGELNLLAFVVVLILTNIVATCLCMAIGVCSRRVADANAVASLCFLTSILFGGFLLNKDEIPSSFRWLAAASFISRGYEALVVNEFASNPKTFTLTESWSNDDDTNSTKLPNEVPVPGEKVLFTFGFHPSLVVNDVVWLCGEAVLFASVSFFVLKRSDFASGGGDGGRKKSIKSSSFLSRLRTCFGIIASSTLSPSTSSAGDLDGTNNDLLARRVIESLSPGGSERAALLDAAMDEWRQDESEEAPGSVSSSSIFVDADNHVQHARTDSLVSGDENLSANARRTSETTASEFEDAHDKEGEEEGEGLSEHLLSINNDDDSAFTPLTSSLVIDDEPKPSPAFSFSRVTCEVKVWTRGKQRRKVILRGITGIAGGGRLGFSQSMRGAAFEDNAKSAFAILGPSGAGKSTLLDILAGRSAEHQKNFTVGGKIRINGAETTSTERREMSGYVTQDDVLPGTSTVWEHLLFHATLRMPIGTSTNALRRRVGQTMRDLGIEKLADSLIGDQFSRGLSGGEKRRVSIATELLMSPGIMFLDEPTTGLDSTNAAKVVDILSKLGSRHGVTVLLSIHQPRPDIFRLLDRILILSSVGSVVYSGPSVSAKGFFESLAYVPPRPRDVHVADFILDVVIKSSKETTSRVCRDFAVSDIFTLNENTIEMLAIEASSDAVVGNDDADDEERGNKTKGSGSACSSAKKCLAPMKVQIQQLLARLRKNATRHPFLIATHFIATLFTAIALGAIFYQCGRDTGGVQNRMGCCFFILLFLTLMSLSSLPVWREDDLLSRREILAGAYGVDGYFVSQIAFDVIVVRAIPPLFFSLATYFCVGLHLNFFSFVNFTFVCVLTNITASALCTCVSIVTPSNASANVVGMLLLLVNVVCGGFLLNEEQPRAKAADGSGNRHILVKILTRLSFINHGFQSMMIGEFLDAGTFYFTPKLVESDPSKKSSPSSGGGDVRVPVSGKEVLDFFSFGSTRSEMRVHVVALASLACAYLAIAYFLLKFRVRH